MDGSLENRNRYHQHSIDNVLKRELEAPNGLSLLVAALDAQDPKAFRTVHRHYHNNDAVLPSGNDFLYSSSSESSLLINNNPFSSTTPLLFDHEDQSTRCSVSPSDDSQHSSNGGGGRRRSIPDTDKTDAYWEKRRRNNEAAKRSREKRRYNDMAMEAKLFELSKENNILKGELDVMKFRTPKSATASAAHQTLTVPTTTTAAAGSIAAVMPRLGAALSAPLNIAQRSSPAPHFSNNNCNTATALLPQHAAALAVANPLLAAAAAMPPYFLQAAAVAHHHQQRIQQAAAMVAAAAASVERQPQAQSPLIKQQQSPDSTGDISGGSLSPPLPFAATAASSAAMLLDGNKQFLRYKLLERQSRLTLPPTAGSSLLGTLASNSAAANIPAAAMLTSQQHQQHSGVVTKTEADSLSLKDCLSSLAVTLAADSPQLPPLLSGVGQHDRLIRRLNNSHSNQSSPRSDHGYDSQDREEPNSSSGGSGDISCGDSSSNECGRSHTGSFSGGEDFCGSGGVNANVVGAADFPAPKKLRLDIVVDGDDNSLAHDDDDRQSAGNFSGNETERYIERRRKNNEAAKRCRANRRALFEYRFQRAQELEHENGKLKESIKQLTDEVNELRVLLAAKQRPPQQAASPMDDDVGRRASVDGPLDFSKKKFVN